MVHRWLAFLVCCFNVVDTAHFHIKLTATESREFIPSVDFERTTENVTLLVYGKEKEKSGVDIKEKVFSTSFHFHRFVLDCWSRPVYFLIPLSGFESHFWDAQLVVCAVVVVTDNYVAAQNTYYYRPSSNRYKTVPAQKNSINSINSIDGDSFKSFNSYIKPYNPFANGWDRPAVQPQYKWKYDSIESDESDEVYRRFAKMTQPIQPVIKPTSYYYSSDSRESEEVYRRIAKPSNRKTTYYHSDSDESDEDVYRRFLAPYRRF